MRLTDRLGTALLGAALVLGLGPGISGAAPGDVAGKIASPTRYPAGLAAAAGRLYLADWRDARIFEIDPADGSVLRSWKAPTLKPYGLTFAGGRIVVCDDHTGGVFFVEPDSGVVANRFQAPESGAAGLAHHAGVLYILTRSRIYRVLPEDGTILGSYPIPDKGSRGMTHDGRYLWVANRMKDEIYMLDPESGKVLNVLEAPGPYPAGLAWCGGDLWCVDFQTREIARIVIRDEQPYRLSDTRRARVEYLWSLANYGPSDVVDLEVGVAVPGGLPNQRLLSEIEYARAPSRTATDRWGQECAIFEIERLPAGEKAVIGYSVRAEVSAIRYLIFPDETGTLDDIPDEIREKYTADSSRYRTTSPFIRETVRRVVGDETSPYWIARKIYDWLIDRLEYEMVGGWDVPEVVLERGSGSCSEYTYSFIALCRAAGLPARYQGSIVVRGDDASIDEAFHRWAEVYLPGYGWVPVDANRGDASAPADQGRGFGGLANRFLITTIGGGDSEHLAWSYNSFARFRSAGYCMTEEENFGFWEPAD
jgi:transglutaminase-like putative cysteine protease/sugar lactone lactonase YvrE